MRLCYLLFAPYNKSLEGQYKLSDFKKVKNAPYFFDIDIDTLKISEDSFLVSDTSVSRDIYLYDEKVIVSESYYDLGDKLTDAVILKKEQTNKAIKDKFVKDLGLSSEFLEEYSVVIFDKEVAAPHEFVKKNQFELARLMRSLNKKVDTEEASDILYSKVSYSKGDLTIVDWEGASVFAKDGDFESDIELFKVANYQLLRYRMIDKEIEKSLKVLRMKINKEKNSLIPSGRNILKQTVDTQLSLLLDFDKVDQSLLLVGDWYSAKLYRLIVEEFYLDDWKNLIKDRLNSLSSIDETVRGNLTFSWERFLDLVSIAGWAILLVGYFYLYIKDAGF